MSLELEQAQNEIAALQRRLTEYAAEVERLKELGRDCYVDANDKSTLNALEECRQEREKLKDALKPFVSEFKRKLAHSGRNSAARRDWNEKMPDRSPIQLRVTMGACREAVEAIKGSAK